MGCRPPVTESTARQVRARGPRPAVYGHADRAVREHDPLCWHLFFGGQLCGQLLWSLCLHGHRHTPGCVGVQRCPGRAPRATAAGEVARLRRPRSKPKGYRDDRPTPSHTDRGCSSSGDRPLQAVPTTRGRGPGIRAHRRLPSHPRRRPGSICWKASFWQRTHAAKPPPCGRRAVRSWRVGASRARRRAVTAVSGGVDRR